MNPVETMVLLKYGTMQAVIKYRQATPYNDSNRDELAVIDKMIWDYLRAKQPTLKLREPECLN